MKRKRYLLVTIFILFLPLTLSSCGLFSCDCEYVVYDSNPTNNYTWTETYRSSWDSSCDDEKIDESVYTDSDGKKWYSETVIECD
jgi:hypothetical protein